jgi:hypothetical protein
MAAQTQSDRDDPPGYSGRAPGLPARTALRRAGTGREPQALAAAEDKDEHDRPRVAAPEVIQPKAIVCTSWGRMVGAMRPARCTDNARYLYTIQKGNSAGVSRTETQYTNECHVGGWPAVFGQHAYGITRQTATELLKVSNTQGAKKRRDQEQLPHRCIPLLADGDLLKSLQVRVLSTLGDIECLKGFCRESNRRGFRRKIIDMIPSLIEAMIHNSICGRSRAILVIAHNKRPHECCCRPPRLLIMSNHDFVPRHAWLLFVHVLEFYSPLIPHPLYWGDITEVVPDFQIVRCIFQYVGLA